MQSTMVESAIADGCIEEGILNYISKKDLRWDQNWPAKILRGYGLIEYVAISKTYSFIVVSHQGIMVHHLVERSERQ
jgi:hypothetical protein